jgi:transforming growth factor-beta-induced protein
LGAALALALFIVACDSEDLGDSDPQPPTITQILTEITALSRLEEGVVKNDLVDDLDGDGPFTVIAPLDAGFSPIAEGEVPLSALMKTILRGHVISGRIDSSDFNPGETRTLQTLAGNQITLTATESKVLGTVNNASVTNPNVDAENGVVHVVDGVLADATDRIFITAQFDILEDLVVQENLESALRADSLTIFAPSNAAFLAAFDTDDSGAIESNELQGTDVSGALQGHVHTGVFSAADFLDEENSDIFPKDTTLAALSGPDILLRTNADGSTLFVNPDAENAEVTNPDVTVNNGVIHGIDILLTP